MILKNRDTSSKERSARLLRFMWLIVGITALFCGTIGVLLPVLPTTPFVILAAFAFAKGSPRLRKWLVDHHVFGPMIADWEHHGAIARCYKVFACCIMVISLIGSFLAGVPPTILALQALVLCAAATYVLTRPTKTIADQTF